MSELDERTENPIEELPADVPDPASSEGDPDVANGAGGSVADGEAPSAFPEEPQDQAIAMPAKSTGKRSAIIAVVALVAVIALAMVAYSALSASPQTGSSGSAGYELNSSGSDASASASSASAASASDLDALLGLTSSIPMATVITTPDGQDITLAEISDGKPIVINVWATWCPHCVREMEDFQRLYDTYGKDVHFVMLNASDSPNELTLSRDYIAENGFTFPVYYDLSFDVQYLLQVRGYPTTAIVSDGGRVLLNHAGRVTYDDMAATFDALVG